MNKDKVILMLLSYLSSFKYHPLLLNELKSIISGSGYESHFFKLLANRFRQLSVKGKTAQTLEEFEVIDSQLYSMHLSSKGFNIRILYSFLSNDEPVLLLAFYERGGKKKTNYTLYLEPAHSRFKQMEEEFCNEN